MANHHSFADPNNLYCISDQWSVASDRLENQYAESRKSETYILGGAGNSGMWV